MAVIRRPRKTNRDVVGDRNIATPEDLLAEARRHDVTTCPLDVERLAEQVYGIPVIYEPMDNDDSGLLERMDNDGWKIFVNSYHGYKRQRFTIAHELAHYFLHRNRQSRFADHVFARSLHEQSPMEVEANEFAAKLLMPKEEFRKAIEDGITKISELSEHFQTSMLAVEYRAKNLGYRMR